MAKVDTENIIKKYCKDNGYDPEYVGLLYSSQFSFIKETLNKNDTVSVLIPGIGHYKISPKRVFVQLVKYYYENQEKFRNHYTDNKKFNYSSLQDFYEISTAIIKKETQLPTSRYIGFIKKFLEVFLPKGYSRDTIEDTFRNLSDKQLRLLRQLRDRAKGNCTGVRELWDLWMYTGDTI